MSFKPKTKPFLLRYLGATAPISSETIHTSLWSAPEGRGVGWLATRPTGLSHFPPHLRYYRLVVWGVLKAHQAPVVANVPNAWQNVPFSEFESSWQVQGGKVTYRNVKLHCNAYFSVQELDLLGNCKLRSVSFPTHSATRSQWQFVF